MKFSTHAVGSRGEELAVKELKKLGYRVRERNFRSAGAEIDIIAEHRGTLVFIEVKARRDDRFGSPLEAVDLRKQRQIIKAAESYLALNHIENVPLRFDVVAVYLDQSPPLVTVLADAFFSGG